MGKYDSLSCLNVLAPKKASEYMSDDCIEDVANLIKAKGGNRKERRKLVRNLGKVETIYAHAQKRVDDSAFKEYQKNLDKNYCHFFGVLALTMVEDYHWTEDETHDQISSILERVDKKIKKYANMGYETDDILNLVEEKIGIVLVPEKH